MHKTWALETVIDWETWIFFDEQKIELLNNVIEKFETMNFDYEAIRNHALKFDKKIFKKEILNFIESKLHS